ncbi:MAG TPA: hypothetical protein DDW81_13080, partial [Cryomorphaceae bacterium]|nr:hypothetical protein [Cryomorphaceae bacterium]
KVTNNGNVVSSSSQQAGVYISNVAGTNGNLINTVSVNSLGVGASQTIQFTVPSSYLTGNWKYLTVEAFPLNDPDPSDNKVSTTLQYQYADFDVSITSYPSEQDPTLSCPVSFDIENIGPVTSPPTYVNVFVNSSSTNYAAGGSPSGQQYVAALTPAEVESGTFNIPAQYLGGANKYVHVVAESFTYEPNTANNVATIELTYLKPDLRISNTTIPANHDPQDPLSFNVTIENIGEGNAETSKLACYFSGNLYAPGNPGNNVNPSNFNVPFINSGQSATITISTGSYIGGCDGTYINLEADASGDLDEENEANNWETDNYVNYQSYDNGDLLPYNCAISNTSLGRGQIAELSINVHNRSCNPTLSSCKLGYYISTDQTLDGSDVSLGSVTVPTLNGKATVELGEYEITIPSNQSYGTNYILIKVDTQDDIVNEKSETNNLVAFEIEVGKPDLTYGGFNLENGQFYLTLGEYVYADFSVSNTGKSPAPASSAKIYLTSGSSPTLSGATQLTSINVPALSSGGTHSVNNTGITIPSGASTGSRYLILVVDAGNQVDEASESNNSDELSVSLGLPDYSFGTSSINPPDSVCSNGSPKLYEEGELTLSIIIENNTDYKALASTYVDLYLSHDTKYDISDEFLDGASILPLEGHGYTTVNSLTINGDTDWDEGTWYAIAVINKNNFFVIESNTKNNSKAFEFCYDKDMSNGRIAVEGDPFQNEGRTASFTEGVKNSSFKLMEAYSLHGQKVFDSKQETDFNPAELERGFYILIKADDLGNIKREKVHYGLD